MQNADYPGRHEPGTGKLDFKRLAAVVENAGYEGYVGCEFKPQAEGAAALDWVKGL